MKRFLFLLCFFLFIPTVAVAGVIDLGPVVEDSTVAFHWYTTDSNGASITRATNGTIKIERDDDTDATGTAITDQEDNPNTGIHECTINLADNVNLAAGYCYSVWVDGAVIDGQTVNGVLARFCIGPVIANAVQISGDSVAADNAELAFDTTGFSFTNCTIPARTVEGTKDEDDFLRMIWAVLGAQMDYNSGTGTAEFKDLANTKTRVTITYSSGDRTGSTVNDSD